MDRSCSLLVWNHSIRAVEPLTCQTQRLFLNPKSFCNIYGVTILSNCLISPGTSSWALLSFEVIHTNLSIELQLLNYGTIGIRNLGIKGFSLFFLLNLLSSFSLSNLQWSDRDEQRNEETNQAIIPLCLLKRSLDLYWLLKLFQFSLCLLAAHVDLYFSVSSPSPKLRRFCRV